MPEKTSLNPKTKKLLNAFDEAAKQWGWEADQGFGSSVNEAKAEYEDAKQALSDHVLKLENEVRKLKKTAT